jgi:hypothetical protein
MEKPTLFTSRYQASAAIIESGLVPVRTSIGAPRFKLPYQIEGVCRLLMPAREMMGVPGARGRELYESMLDAHGIAVIQADLDRISAAHDNRGLVLLCFCNLAVTGGHCHRRLAAEWLEQHTGQVIPEL